MGFEEFLENNEVMKYLQENGMNKEVATDIYNIATDLQINDGMRNFIMPDVELLPESYGFPKGLSTFDYAKLLLKKQLDK